MAAIRNGILVLVISVLPATANAGCGLFSPCGSPSWIGFSFALPVPRLPHLHTFAHCGYQSPFCGAGNCGWGGYGTGLRYGLGGCCSPCAPAVSPPVLAPSSTYTPPLTVPSACNPCAIPMTQTEFVPQQTVSYREVPQIQYRQEAYTESVPVTSYQQVTRFRSVPYRTVARIPQVSTQYVPQQRTSYYTPTVACDPCLSGTSVSQYGLPAAAPYGFGAQDAGVPVYPSTPAPQADANAEWQTIPQRQARQDDGIEQMGGYSNSYRARPRRSAFQPAPSAATAWQSRWLR